MADECRIVEVDGEPIRVHGGSEMDEAGREAFAQIVRAAKAKMAAEQCTATHPLLDRGAPCRWLAGHEADGIPHTTANGISWYDDPESSNAEEANRG